MFGEGISQPTRASRSRTERSATALGTPHLTRMAQPTLHLKTVSFLLPDGPGYLICLLLEIRDSSLCIFPGMIFFQDAQSPEAVVHIAKLLSHRGALSPLGRVPQNTGLQMTELAVEPISLPPLRQACLFLFTTLAFQS